METKEWVMPAHMIAGAGIVIHEKDEVLSVKTHRDGRVFPGGQVEVGENVIDAVKREVMEYAGRPIYLKFVTKPVYELKLERLIQPVCDVEY